MKYVLDRNPIHLNTWLVIDPAGEVDTRLGLTFENLRATGIADSVLRPYANASLRFFSWVWERNITAALPFTPFDPEMQVRAIIDQFIIKHRGTIRTSTTDPEIRYIDGEQDVLCDLQEVMSGLAYTYEGLIKSRHYLFKNPIMLPEERRTAAFIPLSGGGRSGRRVMTKFFFRVTSIERPGPRVDDPSLVSKILDALEAFKNCPRSLILLVKIAIWGLGRLSEQVRLTIWDWWEASRFGNLIATTNKGRGKKRVKNQLIPDELTEELQEWANHDRVKLDKHGRSLKDWREFLTDERYTAKERQRQAMETPLLPNRKKGFYSKSGVRDVWYAPALRAAGLPTRFHLLRHAGVCDANAMFDAMPVSELEKKKMKVAFGRQLGWAWPEVMVDWYSTAVTRTIEIEVAADWQRDRAKHMRLIAEGETPPRPRTSQSTKPSLSDGTLKALLGFKTGAKRPMRVEMAA